MVVHVSSHSSPKRSYLKFQNVHGFFTLPGLVDRPYIYSITHLSEGRSFCTRSVTVSQPTKPSLIPSTGIFDVQDAESQLGKICFTCICSFKRDEVGATRHQVEMDLEETYSVAIRGRDPETHPVPPQVDAPWYRKFAAEQSLIHNFPGLDMRRVDMSLFNESKSPADYRTLTYYRCIGSMPPTDYNLHACAHLYASDRNSCFIISNAVGFGDEVSAMASLSHSVVFHVSSKDLVLTEGEWWCQEAWTPRSEGGRGMHESRIWDKRGLHVASSWQDGLVRKAERVEDQKQKWGWVEEMERMGTLGREQLKALGRFKL
jgi:acyl-CoA thioesterase II